MRQRKEYEDAHNALLYSFANKPKVRIVNSGTEIPPRNPAISMEDLTQYSKRKAKNLPFLRLGMLRPIGLCDQT